MEKNTLISILFLLLASCVDGAHALDLKSFYCEYFDIGGIIGIAIGCFVVIVVIPVIICICCAGAIGCATAATTPQPTVAVIPATHTTTTVNYPPMYNPGMQGMPQQYGMQQQMGPTQQPPPPYAYNYANQPNTVVMKAN